jgi:zinc protease
VAYDWHNYGKSTIGNRSDIERVPADRLRVFYKKYYQPDNAMIIVAGKFEEPKALQLVEKYFGPLPKPQRKLEEPYTEEPPQEGERSVTVRRVGDVGEVAMLYHVPAGPDPQFAAVDTLVQVLTYSPAAPLYKALVETHKAATIGGFVEGLHDPGYAMFFATVPKGQSVEEVKQIMADLLDHVASGEISGEQVERIKRRFESSRDREMADTSRLAIDLSNWAAQGDWRLFFLMRDRMEKVSPSDVKEMASKFLKPSNRTVGLFIPSKGC